MSGRRPDPRITWTVDYMHRRMDSPMGVRQLAACVNLSPSRFAALFLAQTGVAPMRYLQRVRLRRARILVERTFLSVKEIMVLVGYSDPSHFARDFRREHGLPPTELRSGGAATPMPPAPTSSVDRPIYRRIRPPRARDPGTVLRVTWIYASW
jgi:transcriptional regulator GlxA family with amidase domain